MLLLSPHTEISDPDPYPQQSSVPWAGWFQKISEALSESGLWCELRENVVSEDEKDNVTHTWTIRPLLVTFIRPQAQIY